MNAGGRRLFLLNTYNMREVQSRVAEGGFPEQHLWGTARNLEGWSIATAPRTTAELLFKRFYGGKLRRVVEGVLGDPAQQLWVLWKVRRGDSIFAASQGAAPLLGMLRRIRLLRVPLIVLVHNDLHPRFNGWAQGATVILTFSEAVRNRVIARGIPADRVVAVNWGPAENSEIYSTARDSDLAYDFVSVGKDNRDYRALVEATLQSDMDAAIADGNSTREFHRGALVSQSPGRVPYTTAVGLLARARVAAIPVKDPDRFTGLTELNDAIALRKPVVMTKVDLLPFDIESAGIGKWVDLAATPEQWAEAIRSVEAQPGAFDRLLQVHSDLQMADALSDALGPSS